jgi:hypothetical protein
MAEIIKVTQSVAYGTKSHANSENVTVQNVNVFEETVPDASVDKEFLIAIDVSEAKVVSILADQALTIKTNSSGAPQETITLTANRPRIWQAGDAALFAGDVASIFVTNASGSDTDLKIMVGVDVA